jgi:hypothetical protein
MKDDHNAEQHSLEELRLLIDAGVLDADEGRTTPLSLVTSSEIEAFARSRRVKPV